MCARVSADKREKGKKTGMRKKVEKKGTGEKNYSSRKTDRGRKMRKGSKREKRQTERQQREGEILIQQRDQPDLLSLY